MKIYIMADLEGISGIYCSGQVLSNDPKYFEGRKYMTRDANVVAKA